MLDSMFAFEGIRVPVLSIWADRIYVVVAACAGIMLNCLLEKQLTRTVNASIKFLIVRARRAGIINK